jgi:hypothetical protein
MLAMSRSHAVRTSTSSNGAPLSISTLSSGAESCRIMGGCSSMTNHA